MKPRYLVREVWKEKVARGSLWPVDPIAFSSTEEDDTARGAE